MWWILALLVMRSASAAPSACPSNSSYSSNQTLYDVSTLNRCAGFQCGIQYTGCKGSEPPCQLGCEEVYLKCCDDWVLHNHCAESFDLRMSLILVLAGDPYSASKAFENCVHFICLALGESCDGNRDLAHICSRPTFSWTSTLSASRTLSEAQPLPPPTAHPNTANPPATGHPLTPPTPVPSHHAPRSRTTTSSISPTLSASFSQSLTTSVLLTASEMITSSFSSTLSPSSEPSSTASESSSSTRSTITKMMFSRTLSLRNLTVAPQTIGVRIIGARIASAALASNETLTRCFRIYSALALTYVAEYSGSISLRFLSFEGRFSETTVVLQKSCLDVYPRDLQALLTVENDALRDELPQWSSDAASALVTASLLGAAFATPTAALVLSRIPSLLSVTYCSRSVLTPTWFEYPLQIPIHSAGELELSAGAAVFNPILCLMVLVAHAALVLGAALCLSKKAFGPNLLSYWWNRLCFPSAFIYAVMIWCRPTVTEAVKSLPFSGAVVALVFEAILLAIMAFLLLPRGFGGVWASERQRWEDLPRRVGFVRCYGLLFSAFRNRRNWFTVVTAIFTISIAIADGLRNGMDPRNCKTEKIVFVVLLSLEAVVVGFCSPFRFVGHTAAVVGSSLLMGMAALVSIFVAKDDVSISTFCFVLGVVSLHVASCVARLVRCFRTKRSLPAELNSAPIFQESDQSKLSEVAQKAVETSLPPIPEVELEARRNLAPVQSPRLASGGLSVVQWEEPLLIGPDRTGGDEEHANTIRRFLRPSTSLRVEANPLQRENQKLFWQEAFRGFSRKDE
jgi:hypothetical protein